MGLALMIRRVVLLLCRDVCMRLASFAAMRFMRLMNVRRLMINIMGRVSRLSFTLITRALILLRLRNLVMLGRRWGVRVYRGFILRCWVIVCIWFGYGRVVMLLMR